MSVQCLMFAKIETEKLASFSTTSTTTSTTTGCSLPLLLRLVFLHLLLFRVLLLVRLSPHVAAGAPNKSGPLGLSRRRWKEAIHLTPAPSSSSSSSFSDSSFCSTLVSGSTERSQIPRARHWHRSSRSSIGSTWSCPPSTTCTSNKSNVSLLLVCRRARTKPENHRSASLVLHLAASRTYLYSSLILDLPSISLSTVADFYREQMLGAKGESYGTGKKNRYSRDWTRRGVFLS